MFHVATLKVKLLIESVSTPIECCQRLTSPTSHVVVGSLIINLPTLYVLHGNEKFISIDVKNKRASSSIGKYRTKKIGKQGTQAMSFKNGFGKFLNLKGVFKTSKLCFQNFPNCPQNPKLRKVHKCPKLSKVSKIEKSVQHCAKVS